MIKGVGNAGAGAPPVIFFCPLSFSSGFDRGTYKLFIHGLCIHEEKFRGQKNITEHGSEARLRGRHDQIAITTSMA